MNKTVLFALLLSAQSGFGSLILTSPTQVSGTGLGTEPTLLTISSAGNSTTELGCVGATSSQIGTTFNASGVCQTGTNDVSTGASQTSPQTLAAAGITSAQNFAIVFNATEPAANSIQLTGLTASFYSPTGTFLYETNGFSCPGLTNCVFPSTNTGIGKSGFVFQLDTAQQNAAIAAGAFSNVNNLVGLSASAADATGGPETFYLASVTGTAPGPSPVPEPSTVILTLAGCLLVCVGGIRRSAAVK